MCRGEQEELLCRYYNTRKAFWDTYEENQETLLQIQRRHNGVKVYSVYVPTSYATYIYYANLVFVVWFMIFRLSNG